MKKTKKIITIATLFVTLALLATPVSANYQSKDGINRLSTNFTNWRINIRKMEKYGGVMGLNETIDDSTLLAETSNSIDVHMMKNTEYGAMAILALSTEYGKQPSPDDNTGRLKKTRYVFQYYDSTDNNHKVYGKRTSTGNVYGVDIQPLNELTYAYGSTSGTEFSGNTNAARYYNLYKTNNSGTVEKYKDGDALAETQQWQTDYYNNRYNTWDTGLPNHYWTDYKYVIYRPTTDTSYGFLYGNVGNSGYARACIVNGDQI